MDALTTTPSPTGSGAWQRRPGDDDLRAAVVSGDVLQAGALGCWSGVRGLQLAICFGQAN